MVGKRDRPLYRHADVLLIRATTCPEGVPFPADPDLEGAPEEVLARASQWLDEVWRLDAFRCAVEMSSPVLSVAVREAAAGRLMDARQARRLVHSVASYLLRWQGRPTPFGLFAGVAAARIGGEPKARWGSDHQVVARTDAEWLGSVIDRLERCPELLQRLPVVANASAFPRGGRLVVPGRAAGSRSGEPDPSEVSIRRTGPVRGVVDLARKPLPYALLRKRLTAEYPEASAAQLDTLLTQLVTEGFLLTSLRAPMTVPDSLGHLCGELAAVHADELPSVAGTVGELHALRDAMGHHHRASPTEAAGIRTAMTERMTALSDAAVQPLVADTGLDCDITVPEAVVREAEIAASALLRLTPYPFGHPRWKDFHVRFRQRYGVGAVVPVVDLVADSGLGLPADYLGSALKTPPRPLTSRDEALLSLVQQVAFDGAEEIVLTEATIRELAVGDPTEILPPPRVELAFQLHAESDDALRRGAFRLLVTGVPRAASSMAGRFAEVLPEADRRRLSRTYAAVTTDDPGTVAAQLSFAPRRRRSGNVARTPQLLPLTIPLAEHRDPDHSDHIALDDLAVSADARQLHLVQLSTGRFVEPRVLHALEAGAATPPLARFLSEITTARCANYQTFDWGAASRLPYLPRLRHGRAVLSPARWLLNATDLAPRTASASVWDASLAAWRSRLRAPAAVVLCEVDLRLPLDLDRPLHRALLRSRLDRTGGVELREAPSSADLAWVGRAHEFLLPLRLARPRGAAGRPRPVSNPVRRDAEHLPSASPWLHVRIHGHPDRQNDILTGYLPRLFAGWDEPPLWWFTRHRDTTRPDSAQHLALYVPLASPGHYGAAADRVGAWAADLRADGLVPGIELAGYRPQTGRYGHGTAMTAAESVFAADSTAALTQIELAVRTGIPAEAVTAAGLVDLASSYAATSAEGLRLLTTELPQEHGRVDTALRDATFRLADPSGEWAALRSQPGGERVLLAWERRNTALTAYREQLASQWDDPLSVLRSLLHLHHVRALVADPERERVTNRLARAAASRLIARSLRTSP